MPLLTQSAMEVNVKFTATNIALGRYVPIDTNRSVLISK
jgi:hypothetical protein